MSARSSSSSSIVVPEYSRSRRPTVISCIIASFDSAPPTFSSREYEYISTLNGRAQDGAPVRSLTSSTSLPSLAGAYAGLPGVSHLHASKSSNSTGVDEIISQISQVPASKFSFSTSELSASEGPRHPSYQDGSNASVGNRADNDDSDVIADHHLFSVRSDDSLRPPNSHRATLQTTTTPGSSRLNRRVYARRRNTTHDGNAKPQGTSYLSSSVRSSWSTTSTDMLLWSTSSSEVLPPEDRSKVVSNHLLRHLSRTERTIVEALLTKAVRKSKAPLVEIDEEHSLDVLPQPSPSSPVRATQPANVGKAFDTEIPILTFAPPTAPPSRRKEADFEQRNSDSHTSQKGWEEQLQELDAQMQGVLDSLPRALSSKSGSSPLPSETTSNTRWRTRDSRTYRALSRFYDGGIKPWQRDKVEEEVVSRLRAPRLNRTVKDHLTGRLISFSEVGDLQGRAVLMCPGMGLTRYIMEFFQELASVFALRIITIERPGIGASESHYPMDATGPLAWPTDVRTVFHHLGIRKFSILAHSAGAVYGMAVALTLPHMVQGKVRLLAPWIPPSQMQGTTSNRPPSRAGRSQRLLRVLPSPVLRVVNLPVVNAAAASMKPMRLHRRRHRGQQLESGYNDAIDRPTLSPTTNYPGLRHSMIMMDHYLPANSTLKSLLSGAHNEEPLGDWSDHPGFNPRASAISASLYEDEGGRASGQSTEADPRRTAEISRLMAQRTWELAVTDGNPAVDLLVCIERDRKVGFSFFDVPLAVVITHGSEDTRVPVDNVRWLSEGLNRRVPATVFGDSRLAAAASASEDTWGESVHSAYGRCELRVLEGKGHNLMADSTVMSHTLAEIAAEWGT